VLEHKVLLVDNVYLEVAELLQITVKEGLLYRSFWFCHSFLWLRGLCNVGTVLCDLNIRVYFLRITLCIKNRDSVFKLGNQVVFFPVFSIDDCPDGVPADDLRAMFIEGYVSDLLHAFTLDVLQLLI